MQLNNLETKQQTKQDFTFMLRTLIIATLLILEGGCTMQENQDLKTNANNHISVDNLYGQKINSIDSKSFDLNTLKSKPVLIVNIATQCGYTGQLKGLEDLYQKYKSQGLEVIGIPSNDFGGQTPENEKGVKDFCKLNYGVSFPLTEKITFKNTAPESFSFWLVKSSNDQSEIKWNFEKFLINKEGKVVKRFKSSVKPNDPLLEESIKNIL